jgi:hypothetical protein
MAANEGGHRVVELEGNVVRGQATSVVLSRSRGGLRSNGSRVVSSLISSLRTGGGFSRRRSRGGAPAVSAGVVSLTCIIAAAPDLCKGRKSGTTLSTL